VSILWIALAAAVGAACRYTVDFTIVARTGGHAPWGTFVVNATGSLAVGVLAGLVVVGVVPTEWHAPIGTGFLGAYTTFSTWMFETARLVEQRSWRLALGHGLGSLLLGPLLAALGYSLVAGLPT
jgi:fluoride exporter